VKGLNLPRSRMKYASPLHAWGVGRASLSSARRSKTKQTKALIDRDKLASVKKAWSICRVHDAPPGLLTMLLTPALFLIA
jgi:hypothetical protein